jgi:hypothetical protein
MAFAQIIEFRTSRPDEIEALGEEWKAATEGQRTARRSFVLKDRNDEGRYFQVVFFDSYESAMENSNLEVTQSFSERYAKLCDGPPTFYDLDVLKEDSL